MVNTDVAAWFWFVVPAVIVPGVFLALAFVSPSEHQVKRWASVCGVAVTTTNNSQIRRHLGRVRRYRSVAAFPFWWLASIRLVVGTRVPAELATVLPGVAAYLVGGLMAELTSASAAVEPVRRAPLLARTVRDYLPAWVSVFPWVLLALAGSGLGLYPWLHEHLPRPASTVVVFIVAVCFAVAAELAGRRIVGRPQRGGDHDVLAADDALRATAVSMTSGVGILAGLAACWAVASSLVAATTGTPAELLLLFHLILGGLGVGVLCCIVRQETWGYRRRHRQPVPAVTS